MKGIKEKNAKWWFGIGFLALLFLFIGVFSYFKMCYLIKGVEVKAELEILENSSLAEVKGESPAATYVSLNGREIFIDKNGKFSELISLLPGYQIITLHAKDKFGNQVEKEIEVYYKI